ARHAFRLASTLAREHGAHLIVLHVKQTLGPRVSYDEGLLQLQSSEYEEKLWEVLRQVDVPNFTVLVEHELTEGGIARVILSVAERSNCDLIVMGTHGQTSLPRLPMGSVAEQVSRKARCPVVTVRAPRHPAWVSPPLAVGSVIHRDRNDCLFSREPRAS